MSDNERKAVALAIAKAWQLKFIGTDVGADVFVEHGAWLDIAEQAISALDHQRTLDGTGTTVLLMPEVEYQRIMNDLERLAQVP